MTLDTIFADNSLLAWSIAFAVALAVFGALVLGRRLLLSRLRALAARTNTTIDDVLVAVLERTHRLFLVVMSLAAGASTLALPASATTWWHGLVVLVGFAQVGIWGSAALGQSLDHYRQRTMETDRSAATMVGALRFVSLLALWSVVTLLALANLGVDITALVAGLGVGGIAVALAVQNVLGDLFASLAIVLDKPFIVGDFIDVDGSVGTVERIGLKTTRVRAISGEQLVFANADLLGSRIRNFGRMYERRISFTLGVTYDTPRGDLALVPDLVQAAVEPEEDTRFDRSHLSGYGASSIDFETVYFVTTPDYRVHMDAQQRILLRIHEAFERHGIQFAFPTQTLYLQRS
ncbi:MAG TPA: mechanosensitive ion channel family protein [Gemmatimonadaceae bacterium]|nr:mechanosensitive ion channel family protein [Gemmatimonadaceae bacterium]